MIYHFKTQLVRHPYKLKNKKNMIQEKKEELEKYFLQQFEIYPTVGQLKALSEICNKAEKDYIFEDEKCSGCENCDCNKSVCDSYLHNVQVEADGRCHLCEGTVLVDENIPF